MIEKEEYESRREKLFEKLEDDSLVILFAGVSKKSSADAHYDFEVNRNFYYLTGIEQENSILLAFKDNGIVSTFLFIDEKNPDIEKWLGIKLSILEATNISNITNVLLRNSFKGKLETILKDNPCIKNLYIDLDEELKIASSTTTHHFGNAFIHDHPGFALKNVYDFIRDMRMIKSPAEIEMIKQAIVATEVGLKNVLRNIANCRFEYNVRNIFERFVKDDGNAKLAFPSIVASGKNAVILHYPDANDSLKSNDLVLLDVGARKSYYCADISRTYPISGRFSEEQKLIYSIVLECNKATAKYMRPGRTLGQVKAFAKKFLAEKCFLKGLINSIEEIGNVYYHGVGHHLGLDTHDVFDESRLLEKGMVITCEPGLYFKDKGIGVRIEDDILITEDGSECLSNSIIKEIDEIERYMLS